VDALGSGAGVRIIENAPSLARDWLSDIARDASADGMNAMLLVGGGLAALAAVAAFVLIRGPQHKPTESPTRRRERVLVNR
jgi:hypothetical protein